MEASAVDPRTAVWEQERPVYRVYFWDHPGHASDEWRLTDAQSIYEVLAWAQARCGPHRTFQVWAEAHNEQGLGLLLLTGYDEPCDGSACPGEIG